MAEASPDAINSLPSHLRGITRICFAPDGNTIFTSGEDTFVRVHNAHDADTEPGFLDNNPEPVTSLSCSADHIVTGCADNIVRLFSYPDAAFRGYVVRSRGVPIRWVALDKLGERVAVCSDDLVVRIVDVKDTTRVTLLPDNTKPVRSAAWDPSGKYLVTAGCDGRVKVYDTTSQPPVCVKIIDGAISASEPDSESSMYVSWHPSGAFFSVPLKTHDIAVVHKEGWGKQVIFADAHKGPVGEMAWSPNGKYLASASGSQLLVWSTESKQVVARYTHPTGDAVCGLAWSPKANLLAYTALDGSFNRWEGAVPPELASPFLSEAAQQRKLDRLLDDDLFGDGEADGDREELDDVGEDLDDVLGDDWIVDDDGLYAGAEDDGEAQRSKGRTEVVNVTKAQAAFSPGATTWRSKKRYLAFNMIGAIDATDQETHNVVNVEFHDTSARRGYHFADTNKFSMASMGEQGIVYAAAGEGETPSVVNYRPYDSWASEADWQVSLPAGEDAVAVAAGGDASGIGSVIVATSRGFVRFFTASGVQRYMWRLGEDVVTMAAGRDAVLVVYREGGTSLDGRQNLRYTLLDLADFDLLQEGRVPLARKAVLTWAGFTSDGAPAMYDDSGLLSVLDRYRRAHQARWVPLLDTVALARARTGKQEAYWPVGVSESRLACITLKGRETEPWFPRPLVQEVDLAMPLLNTDNAQGKLEESVVRSSVAVSLYGEDPAALVAIDKELLQLVQGACKADSLARALDLARLMHNPGSLDAAMRIADFYHLPGLHERIQTLRADRERGLERTRRVNTDVRRDVSPPPRRPLETGRQLATDFAPAARRRTFAGRAARNATPINSLPPVVPETPGGDEDYFAADADGEVDDGFAPLDDSHDFGTEFDTHTQANTELDDERAAAALFSPKRKRAPVAEEDSFPPLRSKPKNPFAKRAPASNPFAKKGSGKQLDGVKSTSFFERVDTIEKASASATGSGSGSGTGAAAKGGAAKRENGKQATLFGMAGGIKKRPAARHQESITTESTETDVDDARGGVLEESLVQETLVDEEE